MQEPLILRCTQYDVNNSRYLIPSSGGQRRDFVRFESTMVMRILQHAERMTAKEAKEFGAGKENSVIPFAMLKTCAHLTVGCLGRAVIHRVGKIVETSRVCIEETALCFQSFCERCEETPTRNGPTNNEVGLGGYDILTTCLLEENGTLEDMPRQLRYI